MKLFLALFLLAPALSEVEAQQPTPTLGLGVAYPEEGYTMPFLKSTFILGVATPTGGVLTINGASVQQHTNGAFLAVLPVEAGTFTFHLEYRLGLSSASYDRHVGIGKPLTALQTDDVEIENEYRLPESDVELQMGDFVYTQVKGTPGVKAEVKVDGASDWQQMLEAVTVAGGLYRAAIPITPGFKAQKAKVKFRLSRGWWHTAKAESAGTVTVPGPIHVVETSTDTVYVRTGPERGYMLFPFRGTRFVSDGRLGSQVRLRLSSDEAGWGNAGSLKILPEGTLPPEAVLSSIKTLYQGPRESWVRMDVSELVPAEVLEDGDWLHVRLHNTVGHCNWIVYDSTDTYIKEVRWRQENIRTVRVSIRLDPKVTLWGWRLAWESGQLALILRKPPAVDLYGEKPLQGLNIVLDPGHSPGKPEGAVGPMGTRESEMNMAIAQELKTLLDVDGASVTLTRDGWQERGLPERPRLAWDKRADLFLSIHNNALPDGADPYNPTRGHMVFYYHPHSMQFALALHNAYLKSSPVADEGLRYGNLLVARESGMPAVLTESDYMMFPDRELRLLTPDYQKKLAKIHRDGIFEFLKAFSKPPPPPKAGPPEPPSGPQPRPKGRPPMRKL